MLRFVRIVASSLCCLAAAAFVGMMVRSYWWCDSVVYVPRHGLSYIARSFEGRVTLRRTYNAAGCSNPMWRGSSRDLTSMKDLETYRKMVTAPSYWGGDLDSWGGARLFASHWVVIPHWLGALASGGIGVGVIRGRFRRFSLRGALAAMTAVALLLGLAATLG